MNLLTLQESLFHLLIIYLLGGAIGPPILVNNRGRRLDHIWINNPKKMEFKNAKIFNKYRELEKPSDHVPVSFEINV